MPNAAALPTAPAGSRWVFREVATNHGEVSLGERPILEWEPTAEGVEGARAHYTDEGVANSLNGTSLLVSYQGIARRLAIAGKAPDKNLSDDEVDAAIAKAILEFRPGKRRDYLAAIRKVQGRVAYGFNSVHRFQKWLTMAIAVQKSA